MARPRTVAADYQAVTIRLPREIMARCQAEAAAAERSLNFMIVHIMREWYARQSPVVADDEAHQQAMSIHASKPAFNTKRYYLGDLCQHAPTLHQYGESGQSLRSLKDKACCACTLAAKKAASQPPP